VDFNDMLLIWIRGMMKGGGVLSPLVDLSPLMDLDGNLLF
jgi:hypothetical protein